MRTVLRAVVFGAAGLVAVSGAAGGEWQISGEARLGGVRSDDLTNTQTVQPWGVDTVTGATPKASERFLAGEANVTAAYVEAGTSRVIGLHAVGVGGRPTPYDRLRVSNLVLAWHGADGDIEAGYVLTPSQWGRGLLVNRLRFAGGRARLNWGAPGRTEAFWTETVEDPARFRYYELSLSGVHHETAFPGGSVGISVLDARRAAPAVFLKTGPGRATYVSLNGVQQLDPAVEVLGEAGYAWLTDGERTGAGVAGLRWAWDPSLLLIANGSYLGPRFNPVSGFYGRSGVEEGAAQLSALWSLDGLGLELRPGFGWKQHYAGNFWTPALELTARSLPWGLTLRAYEYAEQPWGRWGAVDHWEYTQAALAWQALPPLTLLLRWEKAFDGFYRTKSQQLSAEALVAF